MGRGKFVKDAQLVQSLRSLKGLAKPSKTRTGKFLSNLNKKRKKDGLSGMLDEAAKFNPPSVNVKKNLSGKATLPSLQNQESTIGRGIRSSMGVAADNIKTLTKGTGSGTALQRGKKGVKNLGDTIKNQVRGSQYTEKEFADLASGSIFERGGKKFLKGKGIMPAREIAQETGRGALVKKRLPMRAISPVTTSPGAVGAAGGTALFESALEPDKSKKDIAKSSLGAGSRFLLGDAIGFGSYLVAPPKN